MPHYPEIRDMQLLLALAQHKHFANAAEDCGISQPAFSARIRNLEKDLGIPIVRRGNKFLGFTPDGELVLKWARRILSDAEGMRQDLEVARGNLQGRIVLGSVPSALSYAATVSADLRKTHPNLTIEIQSLSSLQIARRLNDFSVDAGITYFDEQELTNLKFEPIYEERYVLLSPVKMAPRKSGTATWKEAAALPLCLLGKEMHFRQIIDGVFDDIGVHPEPAVETNAFTAALAQVTNGSAATIAPKQLTDSLYVDQTAVELDLVKPEVGQMIGLATTGHEPTLPAIDALRETIGLSS